MQREVPDSSPPEEPEEPEAIAAAVAAHPVTEETSRTKRVFEWTTKSEGPKSAASEPSDGGGKRQKAQATLLPEPESARTCELCQKVLKTVAGKEEHRASSTRLRARRSRAAPSRRGE